MLVLALISAWYGYCKVWARRRYPRRYLAHARKHLDPQAAPRPGAEPVELPIVRRQQEVSGADTETLRTLYTPDCVFHPAGRKQPIGLEAWTPTPAHDRVSSRATIAFMHAGAPRMLAPAA